MVVVLDCRGGSSTGLTRHMALLKRFAITLNQHYPVRALRGPAGRRQPAGRWDRSCAAAARHARCCTARAAHDPPPCPPPAPSRTACSACTCWSCPCCCAGRCTRSRRCYTQTRAGVWVWWWWWVCGCRRRPPAVLASGVGAFLSPSPCPALTALIPAAPPPCSKVVLSSMKDPDLPVTVAFLTKRWVRCGASGWGQQGSMVGHQAAAHSGSRGEGG